MSEYNIGNNNEIDRQKKYGIYLSMIWFIGF